MCECHTRFLLYLRLIFDVQAQTYEDTSYRVRGVCGRANCGHRDIVGLAVSPPWPSDGNWHNWGINSYDDNTSKDASCGQYQLSIICSRVPTCSFRCGEKKLRWNFSIFSFLFFYKMETNVIHLLWQCYAVSIRSCFESIWNNKAGLVKRPFLENTALTKRYD